MRDHKIQAECQIVTNFLAVQTPTRNPNKNQLNLLEDPKTGLATGATRIILFCGSWHGVCLHTCIFHYKFCGSIHSDDITTAASTATVAKITAAKVSVIITSMACPPHAVVIPYPAQGHVIPLMEVAHALADRGFNVTFVNTEFNHARVVASMSNGVGSGLGRIRLVAVPDGMAPGEDRNQLVRLTILMAEFMAPKVEELILRSGEAAVDGGKITCMVMDYNVGYWAVDIARRTGIPVAAVWPASAAVMVTLLSFPKLGWDIA